jgi:hypothetical protein
MSHKRIVASVAVAAGLAGSGLLFSEAWSNPAPAPPKPASSSTAASIDGAAGRAANTAALVMMCQAGQHDAEAEASYLAAAAAHPDLARDLGPDCRFDVVTP